ncbi:MAG: hypothetical protein IIX80_05045 [Clostridia bacterium]|nr:hypothetical protein [Clostridia bacterium]
MLNKKRLMTYAAAVMAFALTASMTAMASEEETHKHAFSIDLTTENDEAWARIAMTNDDMVKTGLNVRVENWVEGKMYDRLGMEEESINILGIDVPSITVPVRPGRNLAIILEIAAMNNRQKRMGYNTAEEFNKQLMKQMGIDS